MLICSPPVHGCGRVTGATLSPTGDVLALSSEFDYLHHQAGRTAGGGHALRFRLGLYRPGEHRPFAWFDDLRLPINCVAFHPTEPVIAIGAGIHDGGYAFNGDLILWNWLDNRAVRPFEHLPEIVDLAFNADGGLDLVCRPWNEDWGQGDDERFVYPITVAAEDLERQQHRLPLDSTNYLPLTDPDAYEPVYERYTQAATSFFGVESLGSARPVFSVAWLSDDVIGWITGNRLVDLYTLSTGQTHSLDGKSHGFGASFVTADRPLIQTIQSWKDPAGRHDLETCLVAMTDAGPEVVLRRPYTYGIAAASDGSIIGRQVTKYGEPQHDFIVDAAGRLRDADFGPYQPYSHYLGIQGAPDLYILQPERGGTIDCQEICRVSVSGQVEPLWPPRPNPDEALHTGEFCAAYVDDQNGASLVVAERYYSGAKLDRGTLYRRQIDGRDLWRMPLTASASAIVALTESGLIATAYLTGHIALLDAATGQVVLSGRAAVDGVPTVIYSMAADSAGRIAFGTISGQVLMKHVSDLAEDDGLIDLSSPARS